MLSIEKFLKEDSEYCHFDGKTPDGTKVGILIRKADLEILFMGDDLAKSMGLGSEQEMLGSDEGLDAMLELNKRHQEQNDSFLAEIVDLVYLINQPELRDKILTKLYGYDDAK